MHICGGTIFKMGGEIFEVKNGTLALAIALARHWEVSEGGCAPSEVGTFLKMLVHYFSPC